jgi:ribosomal protein L7/L12
VAALQAGNKIEAIRMVREARNLGLKEAKDAVDAYLATQPALQASLAERAKEAQQMALRWLAGVVLLLVALYFVLR